MAIEYRLTLAGSTPLEQVSERVLPEPDEPPIGIPPLLAADLYDRYGFEVTIRAGRNGYFDAESDSGIWVLSALFSSLTNLTRLLNG